MILQPISQRLDAPEMFVTFFAHRCMRAAQNAACLPLRSRVSSSLRFLPIFDPTNLAGDLVSVRHGDVPATARAGFASRPIFSAGQRSEACGSGR